MVEVCWLRKKLSSMILFLCDFLSSFVMTSVQDSFLMSQFTYLIDIFFRIMSSPSETNDESFPAKETEVSKWMTVSLVKF